MLGWFSPVTVYFTSKRITWTCSPGRAPHIGGLWEATVKSTKSLLKKLLGSQSLPVEEYWSVLVDVESILNSRPLCPLNTLPEDGLEVLTIGHFLVGRPLTALPQLSLKDLPMSSVKQWNLCQKVSAEFWQRWTRVLADTPKATQMEINAQELLCWRYCPREGSSTVHPFLATSTCY